MKEFKGTSGPWGVSFHGANNCWVVDSDKDKPIAKILKIENSAEQQKANFNLIAAAPDLMEALLRVRAQFSQAGVSPVAGSLNPVEDNFSFINSAIDKALGESQ